MGQLDLGRRAVGGECALDRSSSSGSGTPSKPSPVTLLYGDPSSAKLATPPATGSGTAGAPRRRAAALTAQMRSISACSMRSSEVRVAEQGRGWVRHRLLRPLFGPLGMRARCRPGRGSASTLVSPRAAGGVTRRRSTPREMRHLSSARTLSAPLQRASLDNWTHRANLLASPTRCSRPGRPRGREFEPRRAL